MHRRAMHRGKTRGDLDRPDRVARLERPHRDDKWAGKGTRRCTWDIRPVHRDIRPGGNVSQFDPILDQGLFERERAAEGKADEIVAPDMKEVARLLDQFAAAPYAIAGQIAADIEIDA